MGMEIRTVVTIKLPDAAKPDFYYFESRVEAEKFIEKLEDTIGPDFFEYLISSDELPASDILSSKILSS